MINESIPGLRLDREHLRPAESDTKKFAKEIKCLRTLWTVELNAAYIARSCAPEHFIGHPLA